MIGNVYVKFREEEHAAAAPSALSGRFYAHRPIMLEFSPVTDCREASCRQCEGHSCQKVGYCNFLHLKRISRELQRNSTTEGAAGVAVTHPMAVVEDMHIGMIDVQKKISASTGSTGDLVKEEAQVEALLQRGPVVLPALKALRSEGLRLSNGILNNVKLHFLPYLEEILKFCSI